MFLLLYDELFVTSREAETYNGQLRRKIKFNYTLCAKNV